MILRPTYAPDGIQVYASDPSLPVHHTPAPGQAPACGCQHHAPAATPVYAPATVPVQRPSLAPYIAGGIGAVTAVAVVGVIAIGLLLAFAASALALAVVVAVLRSLLNPPTADRTRRR